MSKRKRMVRHSRIFRTAPFFMLRKPLLPLNSLEKILSGINYYDSLAELGHDPYVKEAILTASPSLYKSLPLLNNDNRSSISAKRLDKIASSFTKYYSRMSSRATPFGLFAGISTGQFSNDPIINSSRSETCHKRSRPDMQWLFKLVHLLEEDPIVQPQLQVRWNTCVQKVGSRLELRCSTGRGLFTEDMPAERQDSFSIRDTRPVSYIRELCLDGIEYRLLRDKFLSQYQRSAPVHVLENMIGTLFSREFLISDLSPALTEHNPLRSLIRKLQLLNGTGHIIDNLQDLQQSIEQYDKLSPGTGISERLHIHTQMSKLAQSSEYLQTDMYFTGGNYCLPPAIQGDVAQAADILWKLAPPHTGTGNLQKYYEQFLDTYGFSQDVPILELTNPETGLGFPDTYTQSSSANSLAVDRVWASNRETILHNEIFKAINNQSRYIELDDTLINQLSTEGKDPKLAADSCEMYAEILATSPEALNRGEYRIIVNPSAGSFQAGLSFGRFADIVPNSVATNLELLQRDLCQHNHNIAIAEGSFTPKYGRTGNIMLASHHYPYEVNLGNWGNDAKQQIPLDDIYVSATGEHLVLKSKSLHKELKVTASNMLNFAGTFNLYRLMREISMEGQAYWQVFDWGSLSDLTFLPRIQTTRVVLSPALWHVKATDFKPALTHDFAVWLTAFQSWCDEWQVPQLVQAEFADNHILLDLAKPEYAYMIYKVIKQGRGVKLREFIGDSHDRQAFPESAGYVNECVFELTKQKLDDQEGADTHILRQSTPDEISAFPFDDWIYIKAHLGENLQPAFIAAGLGNITRSLQLAGCPGKIFYIRFSDPDPSVRIRIKTGQQPDYNALLKSLQEWMQTAKLQYGVRQFDISTYEREIGRYGGPSLFPLAEEVFCDDSASCMDVIRSMQEKRVQLPDYIVGTFSFLSLLSSFAMSYQEEEEFLASLTNTEEYANDYKMHKQSLLHYFTHDNSVVNSIVSLFESRQQHLQMYASKITSSGSSAWSSKEQIAQSLLHMNANRLYGTDREREKKTLVLAHHTVRTWNRSIAYKISRSGTKA